MGADEEVKKERMRAFKLNLIHQYSSDKVEGKEFVAFQVKDTPIFQGKKHNGLKVQAIIQHGDSLFKLAESF
jgi:hypothetical protein